MVRDAADGDAGGLGGRRRRAFDLSYAALTDPQQELFRLLGLVPGPGVTPPAAAALAGRSVADARGCLEASRRHICSTVDRTSGSPPGAETTLLRTLEAARASGFRVLEGRALAALAEIGLGRGDPAAVARQAALALDIQAATGWNRGHSTLRDALEKARSR